MPKMTCVLGDITRQTVDAIVNAANKSLLGGGGVDGAIHHAAGPELLAECRTLGGCPTGFAKITLAYRLPARFVVHVVGPVWQDGHHGETELLASCYRESLALAADARCRSVAFPAISCGAFGYPAEAACEVAVTAVAGSPDFIRLDEIRFVCFSRTLFDLYERRIQSLPPF